MNKIHQTSNCFQYHATVNPTSINNRWSSSEHRIVSCALFICSGNYEANFQIASKPWMNLFSLFWRARAHKQREKHRKISKTKDWTWKGMKKILNLVRDDGQPHLFASTVTLCAIFSVIKNCKCTQNLNRLKSFKYQQSLRLVRRHKKEIFLIITCRFVHGF